MQTPDAIRVFVGLLTIAGLLTIQLGCASTESVQLENDWKFAKRENTIEAMKAHVAKYPGSTHSLEAKNRINTLEIIQSLEEAKHANTADAYEHFLLRFPASEHTIAVIEKLRGLFDDAQEERMKIEWKQAAALDTERSLSEHLSLYKNSPFIEEARKRLEIIAPDTSYKLQLERLKAYILANDAKRKGVPASYSDFTFLFFPALVSDQKTGLIFKDLEYHHVKLPTKPEPLSRSAEFLQLRGIEPYGSFILLINESEFQSVEEFGKRFDRLVLGFLNTRCSALTGDDCGARNFRYNYFGWETQPKPKDKLQLYENILRMARARNSYTTVQPVLDPKRWEDSDFFNQLVDKLSSVAFSKRADETDIATASLLYIQSPRGDKALVDGGEFIVTSLTAALRHPIPDVLSGAERVLSSIGAPAVPALIEILDDPKLRWRGMRLLGDIRDVRAIKPLAARLIDWDVGPDAAAALQSFGWKLTTSAEIVHHWIATRNKEELIREWQRTKAILLEDFDSENRSLKYNALKFLIALGEHDVLPDLISRLRSRNDANLAEFYLNCGNSELEKAGAEWAKSHGYIISRSPFGGEPVRWGHF